MLSEKSSTSFWDLRLAVRSLRRSPAFTVIAVLTLGLGIGANTSAFSVLNEVFFRALPYPDSGQLDRIYRKTPQNARGGVSPADWLDLQSELKGYGEVTAYALTEMSLSAPGEPAEIAAGLRVSENFFATLGVEPEHGRSFRPEEATFGNHQVLVTSQKYWQSRFGGDTKILGRKVRVDGEPYEIVGVMPEKVEDWRHLGAFDLYRPLGLTEAEKTDRSSTGVRLMGRRSADVTERQGAEILAAFGSRLAAAYPAVHAGTSWRSLAVHKAVAPDNGPAIFGMLIGLSVFVLLIACSNLANLLLARTMARARELAVRTALGASRARLLRPLFLESLVLALAGGVAAVFFSFWTNDWLRNVGIENEFNTDWRVLSWAFTASLFTVVAFGVGPALFALRLDPNRTLKAGSRGTTGDRGHQRFRHVLIVGQFALAMILLAGAALFVRGIHELNHRHHGWESDRLVTGSLLLPKATYADDEKIVAFQRLALEKLEALPGVGSASLSYAMPYFGLGEPRKYVVAGRETPEPGHEPVAVINGVSPHYFETVGTKLVAGRAFDERDRLDAPKVFVINQAMAHGFFGDESPLGRRIGRAGEGRASGPGADQTVEWGEIVGVVGDIESIYPEKTAVPYQLYQPMAQEPRQANEIAVRTGASAPPNVISTLVESIRRAMAALDPDLPVRLLQPAETTIAKANFGWGVLGTMLSFLAVLGLFLASLGIYGVISRTVAQRTGEFGIRLALGALAGDIARLVLSSGAKLAAVGAGIGLLGAFGIARLLAGAFPGMHANSAAVLLGVTLLLAAVALFASWVPARAAARIDPTETLRME